MMVWPWNLKRTRSVIEKCDQIPFINFSLSVFFYRMQQRALVSWFPSRTILGMLDVERIKNCWHTIVAYNYFSLVHTWNFFIFVILSRVGYYFSLSHQIDGILCCCFVQQSLDICGNSISFVRTTNTKRTRRYVIFAEEKEHEKPNGKTLTTAK